MLVEGRRELGLAVRNNIGIDSVFCCPALFRGPGDFEFIESIAVGSGAQIFECAGPVYAALAYRESTEPFIAVARRKKLTLEKIVLSENPLIIIAESVEKPGNLGGILRSADAVGVDMVIVCDMRVDLYNPNVVRASLGTLFSVQALESSPEDTAAFLEARGIGVFAATPDAEQDYTEADLSGPSAILVGSEQDGLKKSVLSGRAVPISIPMSGQSDSLNVSVSAAVILFEARRQRKRKHDSCFT